MLAARIVVGLLGLFTVQAVLRSAVRTVVVPRGESTFLTTVTYKVTRAVYVLISKGQRSAEGRERVFARYAPTSLLLLTLTWATGTIIGFAMIFWALGGRTWRSALSLSGSAITTLGFHAPKASVDTAVSVMEALIGLGLVALLISFLPTIYSLFSRRETAVVKLDVRAGSPPSALEMLSRFHRIGWLGDIHQDWAGWEDWFTELEESHTSHPALVFFRSQRPNSSWITAAGCVLDTAAITLAVLDQPMRPEAAVMIRAGSMALRSICRFFGVPVDEAPAPNAPIAIHRQEFELLCGELEAQGIALVADREQAWRDFAGWRVNYDLPLLALCKLVGAPSTPWSSDRVERIHPPRLGRRGWVIDPPDTPPSW